MRTTVNIDDELLELAKQRAHAQHLSLGEYLDRAIQVEVMWQQSQPTRRPLRVFHGTGMRPGIDPTKNPWHWEDDEPDSNGLFHA